MKPEARIAADGLAAAIHGACQIWSGAYDTLLIVAHAKPSMAPYQDLMQWAMDPIYLQPLGVDFLTSAGLQAQVFAANDPGAEQRWAELVSTRRADTPRAISADEILASPMVASPLRAEMCAPMEDGAAAIVLSAVPGKGSEPPRISGVGHDLASHDLGDRELGIWRGLERACNRAYRVAEIDSPASAFDLAEPSCLFPHEEELFVAATGIDGKTRLSPDGGLFAGHTPVVAGLSRLVAAASAMRRDSGCSRALAHVAWGPAGQGQAVMILEAGTP
jgi:acetyl-CoA acetyltransferase